MAKRKHSTTEWTAFVDRETATELLRRTHRRLQLLSGASSMLGSVFAILLFLVWTGRLSTATPARLGALTIAAVACFVNAYMYRRSMRRQAAHFAGEELPDQVLRATRDGLDVWARAHIRPIHLTWDGLRVKVIERQGAHFLRFSPDPPFNARDLSAVGLPAEAVDGIVRLNEVQISAAILDVSVEDTLDALRDWSGGRVRLDGDGRN